MPFDVNGVFSLPNGYRANTGETIQPSQHNPPLEDIAAAMSQVFVRDGRAPATGNWNLNGNRIISAADGVNDTDLATVGQSAAKIGDYLNTARNPGSKYLRRDGSIYNIADYPTLGALFSPLPAGISWVVDTAPPWGSATPSGIAISPTRVIVTVGSTAYLTTDGQTWTTKALPVTASAPKSIAYGNGRWVVIGTGGQTTVSIDDGNTWSAPTAPLQAQPLGILFGGGFFAVTHFSGVVGSSTCKISTSVDGLSFADRTSPQQALYRLLISDANGVVADDSGGYYYTSLTGDTFTQVTPNISASSIVAGARQSGNLVFAGQGGVINVGTSLTALTAPSSGTTQNLNDLLYSGTFFVTVGNSGVCRFSSDNGATWGASATGTTANLVGMIDNTLQTNQLLTVGSSVILRGAKTTSSQFRVPNDGGTTGWIKAL